MLQQKLRPGLVCFVDPKHVGVVTRDAQLRALEANAAQDLDQLGDEVDMVDRLCQLDVPVVML